ncbi:MAG: hypothetical protein AAFR93_05770 [Pseudomonadota bacterium]
MPAQLRPFLSAFVFAASLLPLVAFAQTEPHPVSVTGALPLAAEHVTLSGDALVQRRH